MKLGARQDVLRGLILLFLGVSVALLLDYTSPSPAFCGAESGCAELQRSGFGQWVIGGVVIPVPLLGVGAGLLLFTLAQFWRRAGAARALYVASGLGALLALLLLGLQVYLRTYCALCLVADTTMLAIFAVARSMRSAWAAREAEGEGVLSGVSLWGLLGVTLLAPLLYSKLVVESEVPGVIERLYRPAEITVVEFFDFQCPHCRELSPRLKKVVERTPGARLRLGYTPLPGNVGSDVAAAMTICAAEQGKELDLAARYFKQQDFSEPALRATAHELLSDDAKFDACMASSRPEARIAADTEILRAAGFVGLPTTYIGSVRILGADHDRAYEDALSLAKAGPPQRMPGWLFWLCCLLAAAAIVHWGREKKGDAGASPR